MLGFVYGLWIHKYFVYTKIHLPYFFTKEYYILIRHYCHDF